MFNNLIMVGGRSDTGKTASLKDLKDPKGVLILNFESKNLPFPPGDFTVKKISDPYTLHVITEKLIETGLEKFHTVAIDSITACMALFTTNYIGEECTNKMAAWGSYKTFYDKWAKQLLPQLQQKVVVLAHITNFEDEDTGKTYTQAVVQGSLKHIGVEADFGVVVEAVIMPIIDLNNHKNKLLHITEEDEIEGFKHVLQVRKTVETARTKIRAPIGMWKKDEVYIDPDVQIVFDRHAEFFNEKTK